MLTSPIFGIFVDNHMKISLIVSIIFGIIGSFTYGFALNGWMLIDERALNGISGNTGVVMNTFISYAYKSEDRSSIFAILNGISSLGMLIGPALSTQIKQKKNTKNDISEISHLFNKISDSVNFLLKKLRTINIIMKITVIEA